MIRRIEETNNSEVYGYFRGSLLQGKIKIMFEQPTFGEYLYIGHIQELSSTEPEIKKKLLNCALDRCERYGCFKVLVCCSEEDATFYMSNGLALEKVFYQLRKNIISKL